MPNSRNSQPEQRMTGHHYIADPAQSLSRGMPLADEPGMGTLSLPGFLREVCAAYAPREALVHTRADAGVERWSYAELWDRSQAVARALVACGLGKGERVGVLMTNRAEFLAAVFGTALAGGVASPLSTFSTAPELDQIIAASACTVLLFEATVARKDFTATLLELAPSLATGTPGAVNVPRYPFLRHVAVVEGDGVGAIETWDAFLTRGDAIAPELVEARAAAVSPADPGALFFSSGSTGKPKGILSAHRGVAIQMWRMRRQQGLTDGIRYWTANGFFWSGNFAMVVGAVLAAGGSLVLQRMFNPQEALELMAAERVNFLFAWPHQWAQLVEAPNWLATDLSALTHVDSDSPLAGHPTVRSSWIQPNHCYGNTETFTLSTAYPAGTTREAAANSHGLPLPGNTIKIVDPLSGETTPLGTRGEVAVKGPTLMLGYLGTPLDETLDDSGFFRTGDGGWLDGEGRLHWEGRLNDIIKTGGANVSPIEIDEAIARHPGVKLSQTVGVPHETLGEMIVSCVVPQDGAQLGVEAIRATARQSLASWKLPRHVLIVSEGDLKMTGSAKVKTADLRALAIGLLEKAGGVA
jgi:fatty-acyl-CoA synthase